jgi:hypothetical protein
MTRKYVRFRLNFVAQQLHNNALLDPQVRRFVFRREKERMPARETAARVSRMVAVMLSAVCLLVFCGGENRGTTSNRLADRNDQGPHRCGGSGCEGHSEEFRYQHRSNRQLRQERRVSVHLDPDR